MEKLLKLIEYLSTRVHPPLTPDEVNSVIANLNSNSTSDDVNQIRENRETMIIANNVPQIQFIQLNQENRAHETHFLNGNDKINKLTKQTSTPTSSLSPLKRNNDQQTNDIVGRLRITTEEIDCKEASKLGKIIVSQLKIKREDYCGFRTRKLAKKSQMSSEFYFKALQVKDKLKAQGWSVKFKGRTVNLMRKPSFKQCAKCNQVYDTNHQRCSNNTS